MSDTAELKKLVKQLQHSSTTEDMVSILHILKQDYKVNEAILRESKAGLAVGKLRSHAAKEVSDLAKELVKKWKNEVEKAKGPTSSKTPNGDAGKGKKSSTSSASATPTTASTTPTPANSKTDQRTAKGDGIKASTTGDKTRDKCMEIIYDALACDSGAPSEQILGKARAIESAVAAQLGGTNTEYKSKIRSLFVNLKDKGNPGLRESIVSGDLSVEKFSKMTSAEMASEERKAADNRIKEENFFRSLGAAAQEAETDAFQCGRCKQRKCRYRQAQTRSADEPMTTFVTCVNCNNRWKFS